MKTEDIIFTIIGIVFVVGSVWLYVKSKLVRYLFAIYQINNKGAGNFFTIATICDILVDELKEDGLEVKRENIHLVYEMGHRYQGTIEVEMEKGRRAIYDIKVIADGAGNIYYKIPELGGYDDEEDFDY